MLEEEENTFVAFQRESIKFILTVFLKRLINCMGNYRGKSAMSEEV